MPGNFRKDDLRVFKTLNAIQEAFSKLLACYSFERITVNALCEEAQISRRTFYLHYRDKYDMLRIYFTNVGAKTKLVIDTSSNSVQNERDINSLIHQNEKEISNLVKDASDETLNLLYAFMLSLVDVPERIDEEGQFSPRYIVFSNFCAGGMMKLLAWQVENKFPKNLQWINTYSISLIRHLKVWESDQDYSDGGKPSYDGSRQ